MFADYRLDRIALYAALAGTSFGTLFSLFGLVTTLSKDEVHFFPFYCILTGLWGILALIEAAIYLLFRAAARAGDETRRRAPTLFVTSRRTLLLHAVWFGGAFACAITLYAIWNSQGSFEHSGQSYALANSLLSGEVVLGAIPHWCAIGLYLYSDRRHDETGRRRESAKKRSKKKSTPESSRDDDSAEHRRQAPSDSDRELDALGTGFGEKRGASRGGRGGGGGGGGDVGTDDEDLEKQPLKDGQDDARVEADRSEAFDQDSGSGLGEEDEESDDHADDDEPSSDGQAAYRPVRPVDSPSARSHSANTIHVESHRRDARTGRDVVSEQDWNPDTNRYENFSPQPSRSSVSTIPRYPPYPSEPAPYPSTRVAARPLYPPPLPAPAPPSRPYPTTSYSPRGQYSPVSSVGSIASPPASPPPGSPIYVRPVSPPFYAPIVPTQPSRLVRSASPPATAYCSGPYYQQPSR
ncbi:hypothetical protein JCM11491_005656 [Sporobolomyces phaffii]